ncbi:MAG TPA: flagellar biosynthesis protein FlhB [Deltaproteobacteria bacterium]|nr:flagellar biosynthesis protein FlhB [Deltaproteobacteria bacterium]
MSEKRRLAAALRYSRETDGAPRVTAKGAGAAADKIIEIARRAGVPVKEDRDLVEVLAAVELDTEIPPELYRAVAEVLAYVYRMSGRAQ